MTHPVAAIGGAPAAPVAAPLALPPDRLDAKDVTPQPQNPNANSHLSLREQCLLERDLDHYVLLTMTDANTGVQVTRFQKIPRRVYG